IRYFFYITNPWAWEPAAVVSFANDRCNQENLIEQLKNGVRALRAPSNTLEANGAYMVVAALAWSLKVWLALLQPPPADRQAPLTNGIQEVPGRGGPAALPGGACGAANAVSAVAVEPVGRCPVPSGHGAAPAPLRVRPGNRCRGPDASIQSGAEPRKGDADGEQNPDS